MGVHVGDVGYMDGNITNNSVQGSSQVGSISVNIGNQSNESLNKQVSAVECPICGKRNEITKTFKCKTCGKDFICLRHQDDTLHSCSNCALLLKGRQTFDSEDYASAEKHLKELLLSDPQNTQAKSIFEKIGELVQKQKEEENASPEHFSEYTNDLGMTFVFLPPGTFMMGSPTDEEAQQHSVTLSKGFWLQTTQVTQGQWKVVMGGNPSSFKNGDNYPVESVSWDDVQDFILNLNQREGGSKYRLPTEAQWEYACRAGSTTNSGNKRIL